MKRPIKIEKAFLDRLSFPWQKEQCCWIEHNLFFHEGSWRRNCAFLFTALETSNKQEYRSQPWFLKAHRKTRGKPKFPNQGHCLVLGWQTISVVCLSFVLILFLNSFVKNGHLVDDVGREQECLHVPPLQAQRGSWARGSPPLPCGGGGLCSRALHARDLPLGIPPKPGNPVKAPDTSPCVRDMEILPCQGWWGFS